MNALPRHQEVEEIVAGLRRSEKMISPKYFYDDRGSRLFDQITKLPEYYPTQTELGIIQDNVDEIAAAVGAQASLIEFGSGSGRKTKILLENLPGLAAYVPVDISETHLLEASRKTQAEFPQIEVMPVIADFTRPFELPTPVVESSRTVIYFPGSTIGNFTHDDAIDLLQLMHKEAGLDGALLIGIDLQKDPDVIERAYNDTAGVTAEFNLNMLRHLNRKFGADFRLDAFFHSAT